jgi:chromosome segregation ATPase
MFYQADKIDSILICDVCENKMVDPRILPCGKSVCHRCVDVIADTDKKRIKCQNCAKTHEIPEEGFPKNLALQKLPECKAKEASHFNHIEEFRKFLDILDKTKQSIESTLECGDAKIRDHCDKVRNNMQLAIEQAHAKLDEFHKDFMDEIDNHEKECQAKLKTIQKNKEDIEKALNESNELITKSNRLLKQFNIDQTELATQFERAQSLLNNLETKMEFTETCLTSHF